MSSSSFAPTLSTRACPATSCAGSWAREVRLCRDVFIGREVALEIAMNAITVATSVSERRLHRHMWQLRRIVPEEARR